MTSSWRTVVIEIAIGGSRRFVSYLTGGPSRRLVFIEIAIGGSLRFVTYLTGGPSRRVVLIGTTIGGSRQLCRILRASRRGGWFLLKEPLVGHGECVVSYGWAVAAGGSY